MRFPAMLTIAGLTLSAAALAQVATPGEQKVPTGNETPAADDVPAPTPTATPSPSPTDQPPAVANSAEGDPSDAATRPPPKE